MKTVLVTGVGGNVGQGIIRNIRATSYNIKVIGCNVKLFSAGNHLCDSFYKVSYAQESNYLEQMIRIIEIESVDLIIPSTDAEIYILAKNRDIILTDVAVSAKETAYIFYDKYKTSLFHKQFNIPFATTFLPSQYRDDCAEIIVKPRLGRGSRSITINPKHVNEFSDEEYVVQKLYRGKEITTAFYVDKNKKLHGQITFIRSLESGMTDKAKVEKKYDELIILILKELIKHTDINGSANLQAIITEDEQIMPFEINCRISGTNSIRSNFGFQDVKYTLQENLYNQSPEAPSIKEGIAVRVYMDVIYPDAKSNDECLNSSSNHYLY